jgi:hypothetical protein
MSDMEMPKYICHKQVWALKIKDLFVRDDCSSFFYPEDKRYSPINLTDEYVEKHHPEEGGYYIVYKGGYKSYSPANAFEDGYSKV